MNDNQWRQYTEADDRPCEAAAFDLLRERLAGWDPFRAWAHFQFWALDGAFFDVHTLVVSPAGVYLVEFATHRGQLDIGSDIWLHTKQNGEVATLTNPLTIAEHKADELRRLLEQMVAGSAVHAPRIEPVGFVTERDVEVDVDGDAGDALFFHPHRDDEQPSILDVLVDGEGPGIRALPGTLDAKVLQRFEGMVEEADFDRTSKDRRIGDFEVRDLFDTSERPKTSRRPRSATSPSRPSTARATTPAATSTTCAVASTSPRSGSPATPCLEGEDGSQIIRWAELDHLQRAQVLDTLLLQCPQPTGLEHRPPRPGTRGTPGHPPLGRAVALRTGSPHRRTVRGVPARNDRNAGPRVGREYGKN